MTTQAHIDNNKTSTLSKGDKVKMQGCIEAQEGAEWVCQTDSFKDKSQDEVVFLTGYSGSFLTKYLTKI